MHPAGLGRQGGQCINIWLPPRPGSRPDASTHLISRRGVAQPAPAETDVMFIVHRLPQSPPTCLTKLNGQRLLSERPVIGETETELRTGAQRQVSK